MTDPKSKNENQEKNLGFFERVQRQLKPEPKPEPKPEVDPKPIHPSEAAEIVLMEEEV